MRMSFSFSAPEELCGSFVHLRRLLQKRVELILVNRLKLNVFAGQRGEDSGLSVCLVSGAWSCSMTHVLVGCGHDLILLRSESMHFVLLAFSPGKLSWKVVDHSIVDCGLLRQDFISLSVDEWWEVRHLLLFLYSGSLEKRVVIVLRDLLRCCIFDCVFSISKLVH